MNAPDDERLLAFLEGEMPAEERARLLDELERSPRLAARLRTAAAGMAGVHDLADSDPASTVVSRPAPGGPGVARDRRVSRGWVAAAAAASAVVAASATFALAGGPATGGAPGGAAAAGPDPGLTAAIAAGRPAEPDPSFVLVLQGWWPDAPSIDGDEVQRRSREYWAWTSRLAQEGRLVAAGDLRIEPGSRIGPEGADLPTVEAAASSPDFLIGMFAVRAGTYEEALAIARDCPHLRYGGTVSVRQVGGGFVTMPGMGDWTD